jgi:hypothetical protein
MQRTLHEIDLDGEMDVQHRPSGLAMTATSDFLNWPRDIAGKLDQCGHATLATAHAIHTVTGDAGAIRFRTRSVASSRPTPPRTARSPWTSPPPPPRHRHPPDWPKPSAPPRRPPSAPGPCAT